ncbi:GNAT family N-acetyltransferase [Diplocloster agilis]|uniref:GNAT family N-acetyltransferase n=1 Tax=Diplocloster agilis TaxID=2850323 RepID=A0A949JWC3_9FIRM|nr:GNAT family protein [Diplocloster agilis]MBU9735839.1 GNAT family N-acetyltransferase [Diplocloster agilis]
MEIRKATINDLNTILQLFREARAFMAESGNPDQWGTAYPPKDLLINDIKEGNSYVCEKDGEIVGTFYFKKGEEPTYRKIYEGGWINELPYGIIHRITSKQGTKGVATFCIGWCYDQCGSIRIDTHRQNIPMQRTLKKNGFTRCGVIYLEDGSERIAYQK